MLVLSTIPQRNPTYVLNIHFPAVKYIQQKGVCSNFSIFIVAPSPSPPPHPNWKMQLMVWIRDSSVQRDKRNEAHSGSRNSVQTALLHQQLVAQGLIDPRSRERACNSAYARRDGEVLVDNHPFLCPNPLKNGPKPLAKLYNSPKNSRVLTA